MSGGDSNNFKALGNQALKENKIDEALDFYTKAINIDSKNHVLYSNRSAAYAKKEEYLAAIKDAETVIEIKSDWPKGYSRKASALEFLGRYEEAKEAYEEGLVKCPDSDILNKGLANAKSHLTGPAGSMPINPFGDLGSAMSKLMNNEKTKKYCSDPSYLEMIKNVITNPQSFSMYLTDQRFKDSLNVLMGIDLSGMMSRPTPMDTSPPAQEPKAPTPEPAKPADNVTKALDEKNLGNAAYKKKNFELAIKHYDAGIELDPTNITIMTNKSAVYFEMDDQEKCREICLKAIEVGRENRIDYKTVAKAFTRIGNSYMKEDKLSEAIDYYNKSLLEHRTRDVLQKLQACEKKLAEAERLAYVNPEIALEEKSKGNEEYKKGNYPQALKFYTESIKRNPEAAATYSNRAATYMKLVEFRLALKDCETCIAKDPTFVKGYVRKGGSLEAQKEYTRAADAYKKAFEIDPNNKEATDGYKRCVSHNYKNQNNPEEVQRRAQNDPEVRRILSDPAMKMILDQCQRDPQALREHIKDPKVAGDIQKLMDVGILQVR